MRSHKCVLAKHASSISVYYESVLSTHSCFQCILLLMYRHIASEASFLIAKHITTASVVSVWRRSEERRVCGLRQGGVHEVRPLPGGLLLRQGAPGGALASPSPGETRPSCSFLDGALSATYWLIWGSIVPKTIENVHIIDIFYLCKGLWFWGSWEIDHKL